MDSSSHLLTLETCKSEKKNIFNESTKTPEPKTLPNTRSEDVSNCLTRSTNKEARVGTKHGEENAACEIKKTKNVPVMTMMALSKMAP